MFETVPSVEDSPQVRVLLRALRENRLGHALLLQGEYLEPLEHIALKLAGNLLDTDEPLSHPDCFTLRPAKASRQITIGDPKKPPQPNTMRMLLKDLSQSSNRGGAKVALVYEADRMNKSTANAFLKTLEEPTESTTLILLTTRPYDLLDTIRSRCFNLRLPSPAPPVNDEQWHDWLALYRNWLQSLPQIGHDKSAAAQAIMTAYALLARFRPLVEYLLKKDSTESEVFLDDEEKAAFEAGQQKGIRARLFAEIEEATRAYAKDRIHQGDTRTSLSLRKSVEALEKSALIHNVYNLREDTCLEYFLLASMRLWART